MKIGFSLPATYLAGVPENKEDDLWHQIYGPAKNALAHLKAMGVTSIEPNKMNSGTKPECLLEAVKVVTDQGLQLTIHGWLAEKPRLPDAIKAVGLALQASQSEGVPLVFHGYNVGECPREKVLEQTTSQLIRYSGLIKEYGLPFIPVLEICRVTELGPVGTTYEEILHLVAQITSDDIGICWDLGHTHANYNIEKDLPYPTDDFISKVAHTHVHAVGASGRTHFPIDLQNGYIATGLKKLRQAGYSGVYNLELYPVRWNLPIAECRTLLDVSISNLVALMENN